MLFIIRAGKYNHKPFKVHVMLALTALLLVACNSQREERQIDRSFYYWRSVLKLNNYEKQRLEALRVQTLYIKFFDVVWDEAKQDAKPVAPLIADQGTLSWLQQRKMNYPVFSLVPVVFITNECMGKMDSAQLDRFVINVHALVKKIALQYQVDIKELQFDCDWTAATKNNYFSFLKKTNEQWKAYPVPLSATIRLHQIKFVAKTGIPPVDKGLLMCYNMGNLKDPAAGNSIIETGELKKYTGKLADYPLPVDVALPLFDWKVLFRDNRYAGLIQNLPAAGFDRSFTQQSGNIYRVLKDTLLEGYELKKGDVLRDEQSSYDEIIAAAKLISGKLKNTRIRVSLYHLDSVLLSKYTDHELESIYNSLR